MSINKYVSQRDRLIACRSRSSVARLILRDRIDALYARLDLAHRALFHKSWRERRKARKKMRFLENGANQ